MGYGKIVGLGLFNTKYGDYDLTYGNSSVHYWGYNVTLNKNTVDSALWLRIASQREIMFTLIGGAGRPGGNTSSANGGAGGNGNNGGGYTPVITCFVRDNDDSFIIKVGEIISTGGIGEKDGSGGSGGASPAAPGTNSHGSNGNICGGGGGSSGETTSVESYAGTIVYRGGAGGRGGSGCLIYLVRDGVTSLLGASFGGGGGGGASSAVREGAGKAGGYGYSVSGVPQAGAGGIGRISGKSKGQSAVSPLSYGNTSIYNKVFVYAPLI